MEITYGSVCSGIEAATLAWKPLGMRAAWFAEIEAFPSAVLAHHYPNTPNLGDMTKLGALVLAGKIPAPDVLVGGTPCQAFSVAGMREGLTDPRGALTIKYVELADAVDYVRAGQRKPASVIVWENVPGVLSDKGNAFGCFLGALAGEDCELQPSGKKWPNAGCVYGPKRTIAWRVLDAQYFGLAQRRRRVFVVASARDGFDPTEVLFEREGVRRDTAPRRGQGKDVTGTAPFGPALQCGEGCEYVFPEQLGVYGCPNCEGDFGPAVLMFGGIPAFGAGRMSGSIEKAGTLTHHEGRNDLDSETFFVQDKPVAALTANGVGTCGADDNQAQAGHLIAGTLNANGRAAGSATTQDAESGLLVAVCITGDITHTLKAEGFDGSEDGTGRGQPIVSVMGGSYAGTQEADTSEELRALRASLGEEAFTQWGLGILDSLQSPQVLRQEVHGRCVRCEASKGEPGLDDGPSPCQKACAAGAVCAMREAGRQRRAPQGRRLAEQCDSESGAYLSKLSHERASTESLLHGLQQASEGLWLLRQALSAIQEVGRPSADEAKSAQSASAVRRLMPVETERLQGMPDDYTLIPWRGKPAEECPDGPRYKAIGNSKAVPVVRWIGQRILKQITPSPYS